MSNIDPSKKKTGVNPGARGEKVLSRDREGKHVYSDVIMFLDKNDHKHTTFITIETADHNSLTITDKHLIYVSNTNSSDEYSSVYAEEIRIGQYVLIPTGLNSFKPSKVVVKAKKVSNGFYAPLTTEGNITVTRTTVYCVIKW
jgi:hedgehog protein